MDKLIPKLIRIYEKDKEALEKIAKKKCMTSNQLIRLVIQEYLEKENNK